MSIITKCTIEGGTVHLPKSLGFPDGTEVLVTIEPLLGDEQRQQAASKLAGSWKEDASIKPIFAEIDAERHVYYGRNIEPVGNDLP